MCIRDSLTIDHVELPKRLELEDKWILSKLNTLIREVTDNMDCLLYTSAAQTALTRKLYMGKGVKSAPCAEK